MSILDIFRTPPAPAVPATPAVPAQQAPAAPAGTPAPPGNIPDQQVVATPGNGVVPVPQKDESPLAEFNTLWDTDPNKGDDAPAAPTPLDPEAVRKAVAKTDFSNVVTPDHLTAIAAGGEEAQAAFAQAMNAVAQQVMVQSTMVNNKLTEQAVERAIQSHTAGLPEMLRSQAASDHLKTANPLFSNPAVKPVIEATQTALLQKFPNATAAELTEMTQNYIVAMGESFAPAVVVNDGGLQETDWEAYLTS